jgi:hypothetical protein
MVCLANIARVGLGDQEDHYHLPYFSRFPNMKHCNWMGVAFVNTHTNDHVIHHGSSGCPMIKLDREGGNIGPRVVGLANSGNETIGEDEQDGRDASAYMCWYKQGFGITSNTLTDELERLSRISNKYGGYLEILERERESERERERERERESERERERERVQSANSSLVALGRSLLRWGV